MKNKAILIVDDEASNIKLLKAMLKPERYSTYEAADGEQALREVGCLHPDLILLDVMMPGIDGFEVCRRLKQDDATKAIPVVMVTALKGKEHSIKAMEAGADDFLNKPVDRIELLVRVKSLLRIKSYHDEILANYRQIAQKNQELESLEKAREVLTHMIVHDLNNPITAISGILQVMLKTADLHPPTQLKKLKSCQRYCLEMNEMVQSLLDVNRMEQGKLKPRKKPSDITAWVEEVVEQFTIRASSRKISLHMKKIGHIPCLNLDSKLLRRVLANLLSNAVRHTPAWGRVAVEVSFLPESSSLRLSVIDTGPGIAPQHQKKVFDKFQQMDLKRAGVKVGASGLGLTFCKMAVEAHGGKIWIHSDGDGRGTRFVFVIPDDSGIAARVVPVPAIKNNYIPKLLPTLHS